MQLPKEVEATCQNGFHQFWRDGNPPNCFGCGKTKHELWEEENNTKIKEALTLQLEKILDKATRKYNRLTGSLEYLRGYKECLETIKNLEL